ncbi:hypothetical protein D3C78_1333020 [compost metagenome]
MRLARGRGLLQRLGLQLPALFGGQLVRLGLLSRNVLQLHPLASLPPPRSTARGGTL